MIVKAQTDFCEIVMEVSRIGNDVLVTVMGGDSPHIGTVVLAQSRPSLQEKDKLSATSSVLNLPGHKDECVCRKVAETLASAWNTNVVCTGGIHIDQIEPEQIKKIADAVDELIAQMIQEHLQKK